MTDEKRTQDSGPVDPNAWFSGEPWSALLEYSPRLIERKRCVSILVKQARWWATKGRMWKRSGCIETAERCRAHANLLMQAAREIMPKAVIK